MSGATSWIRNVVVYAYDDRSPQKQEVGAGW